MKFVLAIIAGILGFILGEGISAWMRNDKTGKIDNSALTWILKLGIAMFLMVIVFISC
jgi:hypothetical protein